MSILENESSLTISAWPSSENRPEYGGLFVVLPWDKRRFAKIVSTDSQAALVEFFRSVEEGERISVPVGDMRRLELPPQTRVFVEVSDLHWRVGRVMGGIRKEDGSFEYEVRFPNRQHATLPEARLHVRCLDVFADPAGILAAGCAETQFFADRRRKALRTMRELRSAAQGLTGLVSASIEIVPHQAAAARRVVQDAVQRYLLADEVGLGKTIEAGIVIRQTLVDDPTKSALVLAPPALVEQWRAELEGRFGILDFPGRVEICAYDELDPASEETVPNLLVVDEAHNVVPAAGDLELTVQTRCLVELARRSERVLLLSATPAFGDEDRLLGLLNLLDPACHPLEDRAGFRHKVQERQAIGRMLLPLHRRSPPVVLRNQAKQAAAIFPNDTVVQEEVERILAAGDDRAELGAAVDSLRDHVIRTYRLHDRLIRARRSDASHWFRARGPEWPRLDHIRLEFCEQSRSDGIGALLESWRLDALTARRIPDEDLISRFVALVEAAWRGPSSLLSVIGQNTPLFTGEADHLSALSTWACEFASSERRQAAIVEALESLRHTPARQRPTSRRKFVCFESDPEEAERTAGYLRRQFGRFDVAAVLQEASTSAAAAVEAFRSDPQAWVLVCDRSGEEGLNLQFAHGIVHCDLPLSAGRLEQRIGRLDRFGRRLGDIQHRVLLPDDDEDAPWYLWFDLLLNGFRVFNRSISDVQFRLRDIDGRVTKLLFEEGGVDSAALAGEIDAELVAERTKLDEQHALESLALLADDATPLVQAIETSEEDERMIACQLRPWIADVLGIQQHPPHAATDDIVRFFWTNRTLLPEIPWKAALQPALGSCSTFGRIRAQAAKEPRATLLRPGSPLFDVLERIARWDDRGIAYATWRVQPGWPETFRGFRLVWVVQPAIMDTTPIWMRDSTAEALRRRAEALLPIVTYEQFLDERGELVTDADLLAVLERDYCEGQSAKGRDINLGSRPEAMAQAIDAGLLREVVKSVRAAGEARLHSDIAFKNFGDEALARHQREALRARRSLERRNALHRLEFGTTLAGFEQDLAALEVLRSAIEAPAVRLDEIGFIVVSGGPPVE